MRDAQQIQPATEPFPFDADPTPLAPLVKDVSFPADELPPVFCRMVLAVAEATQTDPAMAGVSALTVLAAAAGGRAEVEVRSGWREPLVLYTATVAAPGERKSAVQSAMAGPLFDVEADLVAKAAPARLEADTLRTIAGKDAERARAEAARADPTQRSRLQAEAISAARLAEEIVVPAVPRIVADDVTPEAAASLMAEQGGRLAVISAEAGIFDVIAGRYSGSIPNLDVWLKGHSGDPVRIDRKGRDPEHIRRPALTLGLMLQPSVLTHIGRQSGFRGRGLLARFLYAEPRSYVGHRRAGATPVPAEVAEEYRTTVCELVRGLAEWPEPVPLMLTPEAHEYVVRLEAATEPELGPGGVLAPLADWGAKYVGAVIRLAGLLHLGNLGPVGVRQPVEADTIVAAVGLGTYFKAHAIRAFTTMATDADTANAQYLLGRLGEVEDATVTRRDLFNLARGRFKAVADMDPALLRLLDHGFLAELPEPERTGPGRRPSPRFAVHPLTRRYADRLTQGSAHSADSAGSSAPRDKDAA